jgi:hypothetical protein
VALILFALVVVVVEQEPQVVMRALEFVALAVWGHLLTLLGVRQLLRDKILEALITMLVVLVERQLLQVQLRKRLVV